MEGDEARGVNEVKKEIIELQRKKAMSLNSMVAKITDYAVDKLVEYFSQYGLSREEVFEFLENNPDLLTFEAVDSAIANIDNQLIRFLISSATRAGGVFFRSHDGWREEFIENGEQYILECMKVFRPELYSLLKDKPHIIGFIKRYIEYKLGL